LQVNESGILFENQRPRIYSVSALTEEIKRLLEDRFDFVWVEGEISNFRSPASGHFYMVLKDEKAQLKAVMFRPQNRYLKFTPEDGMNVIAQGRIGLYQPRGEYQIILDYLEPLGVGALALAFEQLKNKLAAQGVFDKEIKKRLPFLPQRVAVITSPTGAAFRDFLKVIHRRFANIKIILVPVKVQGDGAAEQIIEALETVNRELKADVIVLTRGGGSLEDLWAFNHEALAHAIRASKIPVVSAVGHEIDTTISDLAADFRAPTPSAAAELLVAEKEALKDRVEYDLSRLEVLFKGHISNLRQRLAFLSKGLRDPRKDLSNLWLHLDDMRSRLNKALKGALKEKRSRVTSEFRALTLYSPKAWCLASRQRIAFQQRSLGHLMGRKLQACRSRLTLLEGRANSLSPLAILKRGYSITRHLPENRVLTNVRNLSQGDEVKVILAEGEMTCSIDHIIQDNEISKRVK
jgi:exodeoxyribonuclease VII large subunit